MGHRENEENHLRMQNVLDDNFGQPPYRTGGLTEFDAWRIFLNSVCNTVSENSALRTMIIVTGSGIITDHNNGV